MNVLFLAPKEWLDARFLKCEFVSKDLETTSLLLRTRKISVPRFLEYASRVLEIGPKEPGVSENEPPWVGGVG